MSYIHNDPNIFIKNNKKTSLLNNHSEEVDSSESADVVSLFTGETIETVEQKIVAIVGESSSIRMLYSTAENRERLIAVPLICWAMREDGECIGVVPWINEILDCQQVQERYGVIWEGYYDAINEEILTEIPEKAKAELLINARYTPKIQLDKTSADKTEDIPVFLTKNATNAAQCQLEQVEYFDVIAEIADPIGTHAMIVKSNHNGESDNKDQNDCAVVESSTMYLTNVVSWALDTNGELHAMVADEACVTKLPVLPGDECLFSVNKDNRFQCFFPRDIAEQIRENDAETLDAIEHLFKH